MNCCVIVPSNLQILRFSSTYHRKYHCRVYAKNIKMRFDIKSMWVWRVNMFGVRYFLEWKVFIRNNSVRRAGFDKNALLLEYCTSTLRYYILMVSVLPRIPYTIEYREYCTVACRPIWVMVTCVVTIRAKISAFVLNFVLMYSVDLEETPRGLCSRRFLVLIFVSIKSLLFLIR